MYASEIIKHAKTTGRLWLGGEMEFPFPARIRDTEQAAVNVAENCGYLVTRDGMSRLQISGGDIPGYIVLDWFQSDRIGPEKVEPWTSESAYADLDETVAV
jgi:hypothetical protein